MPRLFAAPTLSATPVPRPCPRRGRLRTVLAVVVLGTGVVGAVEPEETTLGVIGFDLCDMDADGLVGPPGGKVAVDYALCIPDGDRFAAEVQTIDATARFHPHARGRIGCGPGEVLVLGNTHRPDFAFVLQRLAELPYVERIERAWFE